MANADFVSRAPEAVLEEHREREQSFANEIKRLTAALARIA
jgi:valyl-tRNA synthetase